MEFNQALRLAFVAFAANEGNFVMKKIASLLLVGAAFASYCAPVLAADLPPEEPPIVIDNPPVVVEAAGGWYIRGDVDYSMFKIRGAQYHAGGGLNTFTTATDGKSFSLGGGLGYQITNHLRADLTVEYNLKADFRGSTTGDCTVGGTQPGSCTSVDTSSHSMLLVMANAYADLGNFHGFTPYVGAGIGLANVKWSDLSNVATCAAVAPAACDQTFAGYVGNAAGGSYSETHVGNSSWRGAWSLMAGASYDLTSNLKLDAGYKYTRVQGGPMFDYAVAGNGTQGYDNGFNIHSVRAGLRYQFGGGGGYMHGGGDGGPVYK
jgi:opacity protein-like surface antigen